jgi:hypothetical protein
VGALQHEKYIPYATEWKLNDIPIFSERGSQENIPLFFKNKSGCTDL